MTSDRAPYFSVIMPVFNEEVNVTYSIPVLAGEFDAAGCAYEIVVVDDGSVDGTAAAVRALMKDNACIRFFRHRANLGPGSGIYTGIAVARGEFVIFIPGDLAMNPSELRKFIEASRDADIVNGLRSDRRDYGLFRKTMSYANIALIRLLFGMRLRQYNYIQAYRRAMFEHFYPQSIGVFITGEILVLARDLGYRIVEVEIEYVPRAIGTTGVANWRSIRRTLIELGRFWWWRLRAPAARRGVFDSQAYRREHVLPLLIEDSNGSHV